MDLDELVVVCEDLERFIVRAQLDNDADDLKVIRNKLTEMVDWIDAELKNYWPA